MRDRLGILFLTCATATVGLVAPAVGVPPGGVSSSITPTTVETTSVGRWERVGWAPETESGAVVTLRNGSVLGVSGSGRAFVFRPGTNRWTPTQPSPLGRVFFPMVSRLPHGKALLFGGFVTRGGGNRSDRAAVYNPRSGRWTQVGSMHTRRNDAAVARLPGGRVLVAGGNGPRLATPLASAEVFHPRSGQWSRAGALSRPRAHAGVARLGGHTVMVAGGSDQAPRRVDLLDTRSMTWRAGPRLPRPAWSPVLASLPNGSVLAIGLDGRDHPRNGPMPRGVVRYRPQHHDWVKAPAVPGRLWYTPPITVSNGRPVVVGGVGRECRRSTFSYSGATGWRRLEPLPAPRCTTDVVTLEDQDVLAIGGFDVREGDTSLHYLHTTFRLHR